MRMLTITANCIALAAIVAGGSAQAGDRVRPDARTSWGKAGVSLEQYWIDSSTCGHEAAATDLSDSKPAKALIYASRILDNTNDAVAIGSVQQLVSPEIQWNRAATLLKDALEMCLADRGYRQFRLTREQARHLNMFDKGSIERRKYLHSLASDPMVLEDQAYG
ncbi:hypothetical protein GRI89_11730 [Altererythrobacter salegens]|uniref:Uncharacterized protein n=1 Tax=Croceibacterium salegens TaxID=1737568 RepID=A0A6I4SXY5_9SPHN|nr:hypothetical protein [Croceibacterium salegens]MXO60209.1 hypothetical protein [Croceibacterium salegens]